MVSFGDNRGELVNNISAILLERISVDGLA